jgi:hypothetical protein
MKGKNMPDPTKCQKCGGARLASIYGKCSDCCNVEYKGCTHEGYVPDDFGIGGGDDISFEICLECGHVTGKWPLPEPEMDEEWDKGESEDEEEEEIS